MEKGGGQRLKFYTPTFEKRFAIEPLRPEFTARASCQICAAQINASSFDKRAYCRTGIQTRDKGPPGLIVPYVISTFVLRSNEKACW